MRATCLWASRVWNCTSAAVTVQRPLARPLCWSPMLAGYGKQFKSEGVAGLGPVEDRSHGLREFVVTDPDGNRIRVGSPTPD